MISCWKIITEKISVCSLYILLDFFSLLFSKLNNLHTCWSFSYFATKSLNCRYLTFLIFSVLKITELNLGWLLGHIFTKRELMNLSIDLWHINSLNTDSCTGNNWNLNFSSFSSFVQDCYSYMSKNYIPYFHVFLLMQSWFIWFQIRVKPNTLSLKILLGLWS